MSFIPYSRQCIAGEDVAAVTQVLRSDWLTQGLRGADMGVNVHYIRVHMQPDYRAMGFKSGDFLVSEAYYAAAISLPLYATLSDAQQDTGVRILTEALA
jgi:dTDP-4-amino-4,6-dideoxygalactose transaminase